MKEPVYHEVCVNRFEIDEKFDTINASFSGIFVKESNEKTYQKHFVVETCLNGLIELFSILDFFSDLYIMKKLSESTDTAWFSFSLLTIICPYYSVYSSFMTFKLNDIRNIN